MLNMQPEWLEEIRREETPKISIALFRTEVTLLPSWIYQEAGQDAKLLLMELTLNRTAAPGESWQDLRYDLQKIPEGLPNHWLDFWPRVLWYFFGGPLPWDIAGRGQTTEKSHALTWPEQVLKAKELVDLACVGGFKMEETQRILASVEARLRSETTFDTDGRIFAASALAVSKWLSNRETLELPQQTAGVVYFPR